MKMIDAIVKIICRDVLAKSGSQNTFIVILMTKYYIMIPQWCVLGGGIFYTKNLAFFYTKNFIFSHQYFCFCLHQNFLFFTLIFFTPIFTPNYEI